MSTSESFEVLATTAITDGQDSRAFWDAFNGIVSSATLCAISSASESGDPHISTAFFCYDRLHIYFLSDVRSRHSRNVGINQSVSIAIWPEGQQWGNDIRGIQVFGKCTILRGKDHDTASSIYMTRFPAYANYVNAPSYLPDPNFRFHVVQLLSITIIDEKIFGDESFVTAQVHA